MQYLFVRILKARGLAHNESPYIVLFLLADPALTGDDLAPDLIDGFRNRNGIRGFDEGDLGVLLADPVLAGDDLAPDLIDGFRNRKGIRGFDEGDLGVEEEGRVCGGGGGGLIERFGRGR